MVCDLTGMNLSNSSLLDEATAAAEAMTMCSAVARGKKPKFLVSVRRLLQGGRGRGRAGGRARGGSRFLAGWVAGGGGGREASELLWGTVSRGWICWAQGQGLGLLDTGAGCRFVGHRGGV